MLRIDEFALSLDSDITRKGLDFFDVLRQKNSIETDNHSKNINGLSVDDRDTYLSFFNKKMKEYNYKWWANLEKELLYKHPFLENY